MKEPLVSRNLIADLLFGDEEYVDQFIDASIDSFTEFRDNFIHSMQHNNIELLRRAGHKIKPVAQIMKLDPILEIYEKSKVYLEENATAKEINESIEGMREFCNELLDDLKNLK